MTRRGVAPTRHRWPAGSLVRWTEGAGSACALAVLHGRADGAEDARHLRAEEDQRDDRDDGDECEDQRVLRETLAFLVTTNEIDESGEELHWRGTSFPERSPLLDDSATG